MPVGARVAVQAFAMIVRLAEVLVAPVPVIGRKRRSNPHRHNLSGSYDLIVKLFFAGVGSVPPFPTARTSNVYLPGFRFS